MISRWGRWHKGRGILEGIEDQIEVIIMIIHIVLFPIIPKNIIYIKTIEKSKSRWSITRMSQYSRGDVLLYIHARITANRPTICTPHRAVVNLEVIFHTKSKKEIRSNEIKRGSSMVEVILQQYYRPLLYLESLFPQQTNLCHLPSL